MSILMCPPRYFQVKYNINYWMNGQHHKVDPVLARSQWDLLLERILKLTHVEFIQPKPDLPDMVFVANAGFVDEGHVIISRFATVNRQPEREHYKEWFWDNGYEPISWPEGVHFEGAGDALLDIYRDLVWVGHGFRSHASCAEILGRKVDRATESLKLVDPRFYHLDTCFCPLSQGRVMWYPAAFDLTSQNAVIDRVHQSDRIEVDDLDAMSFCCNAVEINGRVLMNRVSDKLRKALEEFGFEAIQTPMSEFIRAGGAAKCLTLDLGE